jgi:hypothetical protein
MDVFLKPEDLGKGGFCAPQRLGLRHLRPLFYVGDGFACFRHSILGICGNGGHLKTMSIGAETCFYIMDPLVCLPVKSS